MMHSDKNKEPVATRREGRNPNRILIASAALLAVALLLMILSVVQTRRPVSRSRDFQLIGGEDAFFAPAGSGLAAATTSHIQLFSSNGKCVARSECVFSRPVCAGSSLVSVYYDAGLAGFQALYPDGTVRRADTGGGILFADVNETGLVTVLWDKTGTRGCVTVYDTDLTPLFQWVAGSAYPVSARVSRDDVLCVNCVSPEGGVLKFFRIDREDELSELRLPSELIVDFGFLSDGTVAAVTEDRLVFLSDEGIITAEHSFMGSHLAAFSLQGDFAAVSTVSGLSGGSAVLSTLDPQGQILGSAGAPRNVEMLAARGDRLLVLFTGEESTLYTAELEEIVSYQPAEDVRQVFLCSGGAAYFAGPSGVTQIDFS